MGSQWGVIRRMIQDLAADRSTWVLCKESHLQAETGFCCTQMGTRGFLMRSFCFFFVVVFFAGWSRILLLPDGDTWVLDDVLFADSSRVLLLAVLNELFAGWSRVLLFADGNTLVLKEESFAGWASICCLRMGTCAFSMTYSLLIQAFAICRWVTWHLNEELFAGWSRVLLFADGNMWVLNVKLFTGWNWVLLFADRNTWVLSEDYSQADTGFCCL